MRAFNSSDLNEFLQSKEDQSVKSMSEHDKLLAARFAEVLTELKVLLENQKK